MTIAPATGRVKMRDVFDELAHALEHETLLVRALGDALRRQRERIAAHDRPGIDACGQDVATTLAAVEAARRERAALLDSVAGDPGLALEALPARLGRPATDSFEAARRELRLVAEQTRRETQINHEVLQRLTRQTQDFLQALFSSVAGTPETYGPNSPREDAAGMFLHRKA